MTQHKISPQRGRLALAVLLLLLCRQHVAAQQQEAAGGSNYRDQFSSGIYNYGLENSVYTKFTGYAEFDDGKLPMTFLAANADWQIPGDIPLPCITWDRLLPIAYDMPGGYSYGVEFLNFAATSENYYKGSESTITVPDLDMKMYLLSIALKLYLFSPFDKQLQPYLGVGWGIVGGDFDGTDVDGRTDIDTTFFGMQNSRMVGIQLSMGSRWGGTLELRSITAFADTNNDPFDQSDGDKVEIDFSGAMINAVGYYRF